MEQLFKFKKVNPLFLIKTGIGSAIAILLASSFGLLYSPSAGIITLLTIQNTKKETIFIAIKRMVAFVLAVIIAYLIFNSIGYTPIAFGAFVFLFVALCLLTGLKDGIAMNAVLTTHFLIEQRMDLPLLINELLILIIGMAIGIILNLIMISKRKKIREQQRNLEEEMKKLLSEMAVLLQEKDACLIQENSENKRYEQRMEKSEQQYSAPDLYRGMEEQDKPISINTVNITTVDFTSQEMLLESLLKSAYEEADNTLLSDTRYLVSYLEMRKLQLGVLKDITSNIMTIPVILKQSYPISEFMIHIAASFHELNNVTGLLKELEELKEHYRNEKLPQSRNEFEYRAVLYQIMKELEYFLLLKRNFVLDLDNKNMSSYWIE